MLSDLLIGTAVSGLIAFLVTRTARITLAGAAVGVIFASVIYASFYLAGFAVLGTALILTIVASRVGRQRARLHTHPHDDDERRGVPNIVANCLVGTLGAAAELTGLVQPGLTALWFVTAIAGGASDTVASELGRAFGGRPRTFPTWALVMPGTPGAISALGTVAGAAATATIAAPAAILWLIPWRDVVLVTVACTAGSLIESALATALEARGLLGNNVLNLINTASSTVLALLLASALD